MYYETKKTEGETATDSLLNVAKLYEAENLSLKQEQANLGKIIESLRLDLKEKSKENLKHIKEISRLKESSKFNRVASEGLVKKNGIVVHELDGLKEDLIMYKEEKALTAKKIYKLEYRLSEDRSKRLQLMHENHVLLNRIKSLEEIANSAVKEVTSQQIQLGMKEEKLESLVIAKEAQKDFIETQFEDIQRFAEESMLVQKHKFELIEDLQRKSDLLASIEAESQRLKEENHAFKLELWDLRRKVREEGREGGVSASPAKAERSSKGTTTLHSQAEQLYRVSPAATPLRPRDVPNCAESPGDNRALPATSSMSKSPLDKSSYLTKTLFLGSGLGLRRDRDYEQQTIAPSQANTNKITDNH